MAYVQEWEGLVKLFADRCGTWRITVRVDGLVKCVCGIGWDCVEEGRDNCTSVSVWVDNIGHVSCKNRWDHNYSQDWSGVSVEMGRAAKSCLWLQERLIGLVRRQWVGLIKLSASGYKIRVSVDIAVDIWVTVCTMITHSPEVYMMECMWNKTINV